MWNIGQFINDFIEDYRFPLKNLELKMKKYSLPLLIALLLLQSGCNDENQDLPEQGHNGPTIDVQHDMKTSPQVKSNNE
ncbi:hypothetical protein [Acinetobacter oleivorans]|uniref:hypothetical protein n=1 Tax=Acinetobacter oleivorans TaxID=1148157 RepID=UPI00119DF5B7|nr:hypothetical protein [Acinetobacter oleivorans]